LYGHGNEIYAIASSNKGDIIISSSISKNKENSSMIIWDTKEFQKKQILNSHKYTVTDVNKIFNLKFSFTHDDNYLISVSRDRCISIFKKKDNNYELLNFKEIHERIIWACSINYNNDKILTASRDKTVKIHNFELNLIKKYNFEHSVTSCSFINDETYSSFFSVGL
jgi:elongator complex protein 2